MAKLKMFGVDLVSTVKTTTFVKAENPEEADRKARGRVGQWFANIPMEGEDGLTVPEIKLVNIFDGDLYLADIKIARIFELTKYAITRNWSPMKGCDVSILHEIIKIIDPVGNNPGATLSSDNRP